MLLLLLLLPLFKPIHIAVVAAAVILVANIICQTAITVIVATADTERFHQIVIT